MESAESASSAATRGIIRAPATAGRASALRVRKLSLHWRKALPFVGTLLIFALIFWRIPVKKIGAALEQTPVLKFFGVFIPFCASYWIIDSLCLTWVVRRFNAALRLGDVLPVRASMNLLSLINSNLGQGGVAWYLHRKTGVPFLQMLSSVPVYRARGNISALFLFDPGSPLLSSNFARTVEDSSRPSRHLYRGLALTGCDHCLFRTGTAQRSRRSLD